MGALDKTEQALRDFHILLSKSEPYGEAGAVIVDKKEVLQLLQKLNMCIYELLEEHEMTKRSREAAERDLRKKSDAIIVDANKMAEDVYAGAVLYTDEALLRTDHILERAEREVSDILKKAAEELSKERTRVRGDKTDLKGNLESLRDTEKYAKLIQDENRRIEKELQRQEGMDEPDGPAAPKPEIRVNAEYFERNGIPMPEDGDAGLAEGGKSGAAASGGDGDAPPEVRVNLDAEYFKWKEESGDGMQQTEEKKPDKRPLFGKMRKGE